MSRSGFLGQPATKNYRPGVLRHGSPDWSRDGIFSHLDIDRMRWDPQVSFGLRILYSPLPCAKWQAHGDQAVAAYADACMRRIWQRCLPALFLSVVYGNCAGEWVYGEGQDGRLCVEKLKDLHPFDCLPLVGTESGHLCGVSVKNVSGQGGKTRLRPPRSLWLAHEPQFGSFFGVPRLREAWAPWIEKTGRHGAIDVRRSWYVKNAFRGASMRHPGGSVELADGVFMSAQDYARELVEKIEAGSVLALPGTRDADGNLLWEWQEAVALGKLDGVEDWISALDRQILVALGIPPEVVDAAESGSGWSGRSVPFLVWLQGEDRIAQAIVEAVRTQCVDLMVEAEFGPEAAASYGIELQSFVPEEAAKEAGGAMGGGQPEPERMSLGANPWKPYEGPRGGKGWKRWSAAIPARCATAGRGRTPMTRASRIRMLARRRAGRLPRRCRDTRERPWPSSASRRSISRPAAAPLPERRCPAPCSAARRW